MNADAPRRPRVAPWLLDTAVLPWRMPRASAGVSTHAAPDPVACSGVMPAGTQNPIAPRPTRQSVLQILPAPDGREPAGGARGAIRIRIRPSPAGTKRIRTPAFYANRPRATSRCGRRAVVLRRAASRAHRRSVIAGSARQRGIRNGTRRNRAEITTHVGFGELGATRNRFGITNPPAVRP